MADLSGLHILCVPSWWPSAEQPISGVWVTDYIRAFSRAGAMVGVVFPDLVSLRHFRLAARVPMRPRLTWESVDGIPVARIRGWHTAMGRPAWQMRRYLHWLRWGVSDYVARHGTPDVLHAMVTIPSGWACAQLEGSLARRIVLTEVTGPFSLVMNDAANAAFVREAMAKAATVVAVSEQARTEIRSHGIDRPIEVCGNPVAREFLETVIRDRSADGPIRALYVGRLVKDKGVIELAEAAATIGNTAIVDWHVAGDGPAIDDICASFNRSGMGDRLHLHGLCDRARIVALMENCDFLVHPTYGETFGLSVAEALCMGLPVVTTRGTACAEFINDSNGLLVELRNAESLADGLLRMTQRLQTGSFNRTAIAAEARRRFSGESVANKYGEWFLAASRH